MASGFGTFRSSSYATSGYGRIYNTTVVSQSVNSSARTVTIKVRCLLTYYRNSGGNWNPGTSNLFQGSYTTNAISATLDGQSSSASNLQLGLKGNNQTLYVGSYYDIDGGAVQAVGTAVKEISRTYSYDASGSAMTKNWSSNITYTISNTPYSFALSGSVTTDSIAASVSKPSSLSCTVNSVAWNSVNGTFAVGNWGGEPTGSSKYIAGRLFGESGTARREETGTNTNSITKSITTNSVALDGGITVKGAGNYRIDTYASNSAGSATNSMQNVYTPPAPLANLTYTQSEGSTNVSVTATITGADSGSNYGNTVTTYYRYSTNGGSTYTNWTSAGTGAAWTAKTATFTVPYGSSVKIQAKQTYQSKDSATKEVSFTATTGTAPSGGTLSVSGSTWNSITLVAAGVNYGKPDGISGRKLSIGVSGDPSTLDNKRENQVENVTGATTTVTNSSIYPGASALDLKGMLPVYPYLWAWNTIKSTTTVHDTTPYYLPPAPGVGSYTVDGSDQYTISYTGVAANNDSNYTTSELTRTVRYKIDNGNWVYIDNDAQKTIDAVTSQQITVNPTETATVEAWLTYRGKNSEVSTFTIVNSNDPIFFYGSVSGAAKKIRHYYGSVDSETVKVVKIYGSEGGVARKVFEDV